MAEDIHWRLSLSFKGQSLFPFLSIQSAKHCRILWWQASVHVIKVFPELATSATFLVTLLDNDGTKFTI